mgnify:CR=1 FL=1
MKGLILAAGLGTRLRPLTSLRPKPTIAVANKPLIHYAVDNLVAAGIDHIGVVVGPSTATPIRDTLECYERARFEFIMQDPPLGLAHAVKVSQPFLGDEAFVMYLSDNLFEHGITDFVSRFDPSSGVNAVLALVEVPDPRQLGVAVGETGLDYYWDFSPPRAQQEAFRWHIDLAKRVGKPLMIHNREADADVLDVLRAEGAPETVIFHCFSSDAVMARTCVDAGWVLSLSGTVSFRNARALHEAAPLIPPEQLLVETDAPFLTPHPHRGAPNEPYCLPYTVRALAALLDRPAEELARQTTATAIRVYGLQGGLPLLDQFVTVP